MRLRCWLDEPPSYTLDVDEHTRLVLDCPAAVARQGQGDAEGAARRAAWLAECADASAVLLSDHATLGALPLLTERTDFAGSVLLTRPTAQMGRWQLEEGARPGRTLLPPFSRP